MDTGGMTQDEAAEGFRRFAELLRQDEYSWPPPDDVVVMRSEEADGSYGVGSRVTVRYPDGQEKCGTVTKSD